MPVHSIYLSKLNAEQRSDLEGRLWEGQSHRCFLCDEAIDLTLHKGKLHIDHIVPIVASGSDDPTNFALTHAICNERKSATNLEVARRLNLFEKMQEKARAEHGRGANLEDVLGVYAGKLHPLRLKFQSDTVQYSLSEVGDPAVKSVPLYTDALSGMRYFFAAFPIQYLHHDDRINPRSIGGSLQGLMEEFNAKRPALHCSLAWWRADSGSEGPVKVFDGQHKAAAQILLGAKELPVRVFINPDPNVLLQANTNAGDKLKQVAFDKAVRRHLGNALYKERLVEYRKTKGLAEEDESFSETDLVTHFKGSRREVQRYILDAVRNAITTDPDNRLMEFVELAGKGAERPVSYSSVEKTFFSLFLFQKPLSTPLDHLDDEGKNPRYLEHTQLVRLMNVFAEEILVGRWDSEHASTKIESELRKGEPIPEKHLCAHRMTREETLHAILSYVEAIVKQYFSLNAQIVEDDQLFQAQLPEVLWKSIRNFLVSLRGLPCWVDRNLSGTVFGAKQNREYWMAIFKSGIAPGGTRVLAQGLDIYAMIKSPEEKASAA